jgi:hypothetical protein
MKKTFVSNIFFVIMVILALLMTLSACKSDNSSISLNTNSTSSEGNTAPPANLNEEAAQSNENTATPESITVESVIFEREGIKLTLKSIDSEDYGPELKVLVENNGKEPVRIVLDNCAVNDFMFSTMLYSNVAVGEKSYESITLYQDQLEKNGIETIATIELSFHVNNTDTNEFLFRTEIINAYTSASKKTAPFIPEAKQTVFDQNGITISYVSLEESLEHDHKVLWFFINNHSDANVRIYPVDELVNGISINGFLDVNVLPGKMRNANVTFLSDDFEKNGIKKVDNIEFVVRVFDIDSHSIIADSDVFKMVF